ncbi:MAG: hypothetical protein JXA66_01555 [Oligoflexia bacterium]|nr:hypothetical protein [Oligoflexia bacterium]
MLGQRKGQVAVEFMFMFILVGMLMAYIFKFAVTTAALEYREYAAFMVGRAITASAVSYTEKATKASMVNSLYNDSAGMKVTKAGSPPNDLQCSENIGEGRDNAFKNAITYGTGSDYASVSNTGIACSITLGEILPVSTEEFKVVIESMTGSEISDTHCNCEMDFNNDWAACVSNPLENPPAVNSGGGLLDNGC